MTFLNNKAALMVLALLGIGGISLASQDQKHSDEFHSIIMPGMNGGGGNYDNQGNVDFRDNHVVNTPSARTSCYTHLRSGIDMGQGNCIADFERQYNQDALARATNTARLFFGVSQGTATLTNWLAQKNHAEQEQAARLLVLEGVLGSGNHAIMHTVENRVWRPLTYFPFARAWIPLVAKFAFPSYNPFGKQAISSAKKLSPNIPVVLMHNKGDTETTINDARKYYCTLRESGHNNAYLVETDNGEAHFNILANCHQEYGYPERGAKIAALQAIYKEHNLPIAADTSSGTPRNPALAKSYQPSVQEVRQRISTTNGYKNIARNTIDIVSAALALGAIWWKYFAKK